MEERKEVKPVTVDYKCPNCETGYLRHSGMVLTSNPPQYPHHCNNDECDYAQTFTGKSYPYLDYEEV